MATVLTRRCTARREEKLTEYYRELAAKRGLRFADASSWDLDFAFDGVHLSEKGHVLFADEMEKELRKISGEA